jgi:hypothetical protein
MGVAASGATLEIQLVADVARLRRDMSAMQQTVKAATVGAGRSFDDLARGSAASAAVQAAAAQKVARAAMTGAGGVRAMGAASGLARTQLLEMSHVVTSLSGSLLAGQNPLRAIALELPRIGQAAAFGGNGIRGLISSLLQMTGIIKVTRDAELEAAAATAAAGAAAVRRNAESAASALVAKEAQVALAQTQLEAVAGTELETAAMARLVTAQRAVADQSAKLAGVQQTLATVNTEAAATAAAAAAASVTGLGAVGTAIAVILPLAVLAGLAFLGIKQSVDAIDPSAQKLIGTLGLTDEQIKKLKDTSVTWGDVFGATLDVMLQKAGISSKGIKEFFASAFHSIGEFGKFSIAVILAAFGAMVKGAADLVMNLPAVVGGGIAAAANLGIAALEKLVNLGIVALNKLAGVINSVLGTHFGQVAQISLGRIENNFSGTMKAIGADVAGTFHDIFNRTEATFDQISARAAERRNERVIAQAGAVKKAEKDAAAGHAARAKAANDEADALKRLVDLNQLLAKDVPLDKDLIGPKAAAHLQGPDLKAILGDAPDIAAQLLDTLRQISEQASATGDALADSFGKAGEVFGALLERTARYAEAQARVAEEVAAGQKTEKSAEMELATLRNRNIVATLSGLKSLFKEHSAGYKAMEAAERAFAVIQAINTIKSVAAGAAKMFAQLGVWAFPAVAAMVAVMAAFGFSGGSSSQRAPTSPEDLQKAAGGGSVLGDAAAKSASIANALELMAKNSTKGLDYSSAMLGELRKIQSGIGNLAAALAVSLNLKGGFFDPAMLGLGTKTSGIQGLFGSKTTTSLYDQGITLNAASLAQIMEQGISGVTYNVIETIKKKSGFLGIGGSTKTSYSTTTGALDSSITAQIDAIIGDLYTSIVGAAKVLGLDVAAALQQFQVEIGQISFKDLTGQQITDELNAVFSKIGDEMAGFAVAGLADFQKVGEGLFETLMRLAKDYLTIDVALKSIGMTFGSVGASSIAMRESLIELAGGLDAFVAQVNFFYDHFLSDAQKLAFAQQQVDAGFQALGQSVPASIADFANLVTGLDLSTDAGQAAFEALMQIAPAFYDVATAADQLAKKSQDLQVQLLQAQGDTAGATALQRQIALAALDPSLQDLQKQVWAAQDAAAAAATAQQLANKQTELQIQLLQAQGKATQALALQRKMELDALDPSLRGIQQQIYRAEDIAKAKDDLVAAYRREADALQQTADKFRVFAKGLREFRDSLFLSGGSGPSTAQALIRLMHQSGLAAGGNEDALGGGLQDAASTYLTAAEASARTLLDVHRARALVARQIDQAIGGADAKATIAEMQLKQLHDQVSKLADIDDHVQSVTEAIKALTLLMFPGSAAAAGGHKGHAVTKDEILAAIANGQYVLPPSPIAPSGHHARSGRDHLAALDEIKESLAAIGANTATAAVSGNKVARLFGRVERNGSLAVSADDDTPLPTVAV